MKKGSLILAMVLMLALVVSSAVGDGYDNGPGRYMYSEWLGGYSIQLAQGTPRSNGYVNADGYGPMVGMDEVITVISKNASLWSEPRTNSKKLATVAHGEKMTARDNARSSNGFYAVKYKGQDGWVNMDYVMRDELFITLLESNVPAYIAPSTTAKKVGSLSKLTKLRVIGFYGDFYIVNLRDAAAAYIPMSVLHRDSWFDLRYEDRKGLAEVGTTRYATKLRTGPGSQYPEIRTLKAGARVPVMDRLDSWTMIYDETEKTWAFLEPGSVN